MRDYWLPSGLLIVAAALVYVLWAAPSTPPMVARGEPHVFTGQAPVTKESSAKKPTHAAQPKHPEAVTALEPFATDVSHTVAIATPSPVPPPPLQSAPVPASLSSPVSKVQRGKNPAEVGVGMPARRVVELLGKPDLKATTVRHGGLIETYVYADAAGQDFLRIQLLGGRVVNEAP